MPSGRIRTFDATRGFGFVVTDDGDEFYVARAALAGGDPGPGDEVAFEVDEEAGPGRRSARAVTVTRSAPPGSPVGRTMAAPPSWDSLEDRERQRRMARRRRR
jgi:CspA family cold shock protein